MALREDPERLRTRVGTWWSPESGNVRDPSLPLRKHQFFAVRGRASALPEWGFGSPRRASGRMFGRVRPCHLGKYGIRALLYGIPRFPWSAGVPGLAPNGVSRATRVPKRYLYGPKSGPKMISDPRGELVSSLDIRTPS